MRCYDESIIVAPWMIGFNLAMTVAILWKVFPA